MNTPDQPAVLEVSELSVDFRTGGFFSRRSTTVHAAVSVSLDVAVGEAVAVVGESGSGKTTVGRCVLGLQQPTSGDVRIAGTPVSDLRKSKQLYRHVQAVFQNPNRSLNPAMTVGSVLAEPLRRIAGLDDADEVRSRSIELLARVGLSERVLGERPRTLSGGMAQRVSIARALAPSPQLIVLDEAVSALDVATQAQVINLLADLRDDLGISYLFIAHDLAVVRHLCDRIFVMCRGEVVESGDAKSVCDDPSHPYTQRLLASVPIPDPRARRLRTTTGARSRAVSDVRP